MPMVGVSHCLSCQAVINVNWHTCSACHSVIKTKQAAPFEVGDRIVYRVPGDPEKGPFEVIMISPDHFQGGWWAVVLKPSENEEAERKPDTLEPAFIHQILVERVIPKESQTP